MRTAVPQAFLHASADAAAGAMVALTERAVERPGQHVEVSAQRSMMQATQSYALAVPLGGSAAQRASGGVKTGGLDIKLLWPCKDGFASVTFLFGASMGPFTKRLMHWIHEEGFCDEATRDKDWLDYANHLYDGSEPIEEYDRLKRIIGEFCATKTKAELLEAACDRILLIAPVATPQDVVSSPQFAARDYFDDVADEALADVPVHAPGTWWRSTRRCRRCSSGGPPGWASTPTRSGASAPDVDARRAGGQRAARRRAARGRQGARPHVGDGRAGAPRG